MLTTGGDIRAKCRAFIRSSLAIFVLFFICFSLQAQSKTENNLTIPDYGVIEKADMQMKDCDFDPGAEAMVLLDDGVLEFDTYYTLIFRRRLRIKILSNKGLDWANVHLRFRNGARIFDIAAQTYNLDVNNTVVTTQVEKNLVYEKKQNKKYSEKVFTFPNVKAGSIIEYSFRHEGGGLIDWYFQRSIPTKYSRFTTDFPKEIELSCTPYCSFKYEVADENIEGRKRKTYSMSNVPSFKKEPYILNEDYYHDRLETMVTAYLINGRKVDKRMNWIDVVKLLMEDEDFGVQIKKNIPRTADLDEKLKTVTGPYEKMKTVYKYVQDNMEWNEYTGIWALDGVKSAWKDKKGTAGEINLILVNLLKDAGLNVHPILVSSHDNGIVNTADAGTFDLPGYRQFNKVMAYVDLSGRTYVLDATQKDNPVDLIPPDVLLTPGLVIEKINTYDWGWKSLWREDANAANVLTIKGNIDESEKLNGEVSIKSFDYARLSRLPIVKKGKDKFIEKYVTESNPGLLVNDVTFENIEADSLPLVQTIKFTEPLTISGDYASFSTNILTGLEKNPFLADSRFSDIFFGYKQHFVVLGTYTLSVEFMLDDLPKNIKLIMPDTSIIMSRISQINGNILQTRIDIEFRKPFYLAAQYGELQEFYRRLFEVLNEQFVMRKKKIAGLF